MSLNRRDTLTALALLGAAGIAAPARAAISDSLSARVGAEGAVIGQAYLDANPAERDARLLQQRLFPAGFNEAAVRRLGAAAKADFGAGRMFDFRGWRLSQTEGRLFALLALQT